ncbi:response regulator transcription factor [Caminibacter sp.]
MKAILIEDDESLNIALSIFLKSEGFEVYSFSTLTDFVDGYKKIIPDLIISDISFPDGNFLEELQKRPDLSYVKILVITAHNEIEYMKKAFNLGAEDFLKKPFNYEELALRIKKMFKDVNKKIKLAKNLYYDMENKTIIRDNNRIQLSKKEYLLLEILLKNRGKILSPKILIEYIWDEEVSTNTLNVLIKRLREKLGEKEIIKTKRDLGYVIEE